MIKFLVKTNEKKTTRRVTKSSGGKSTVNKAGNYTKPTMRKNLLIRLKLVAKVVSPVNGVLEKAQMLAKQYKAKGGGYKVKEDINTIILRRPLFLYSISSSCLTIIPPTLVVTMIYFYRHDK